MVAIRGNFAELGLAGDEDSDAPLVGTTLAYNSVYDVLILTGTTRYETIDGKDYAHFDYSAQSYFPSESGAGGTVISGANEATGELTVSDGQGNDHVYQVFGANSLGNQLFFGTLKDDGTPDRVFMLPSPGGAPAGGSLSFRSDFDYRFLPCFLAGTRIRTERGDVPVEALKAGDMVLTLFGESRPVVWVGMSGAHTSGSPSREARRPIRIMAGAIEPRVPERDLCVSPGHALHIDGHLLLAGDLVNGATVIRERCDKAVYYHVELDQHDVLFAEGMPAESFFDDGNRWTMRRVVGDDGQAVYEDSPRVADLSGGEALTAARWKLIDRALALGMRFTDRADVSLRVDGVMLAPLAAVRGRFWFCLPQGAQDIAIVSPAGLVGDADPNATDPRRLGVAIREIRADGDVVALDSGALAGGFHDLEKSGDDIVWHWRWTDGAGLLHFGQPVRMIELRVAMALRRLEMPHIVRELAAAA